MQTPNKKAFTLVELIVVITILAILGTIAFVSLQGYSRDSRNSVRITDIKTTETALELYSLQTGKYPLPDNYEVVTTTGSIDLWNKGQFDTELLRKLDRLSELPKDPKTEDLMGYSTTLQQKEYELKYNLEFAAASPSPYKGEGLGGGLFQTQAISSNSYVKGNYNGLFVVGRNNAYYSTPGLFSEASDVTSTGTFDLHQLQTQYQVKGITNSGTLITTANLSNNEKAFAVSLKGQYANNPDLTSGIYEVLANLDVTSTGQLTQFTQAVTSGKASSLIVAANNTETPAASYSVGKSLLLNGTNQYLDKNYINDSNSSWTFSAWVKRSSNTGLNIIYGSAGDQSGYNDDFEMIYFDNSGHLVLDRMTNFSNTYKTSTATFTDQSKWYHVMVSLDAGNSIKMYVDGIEITDFQTNNIVDSNPYLINKTTNAGSTSVLHSLGVRPGNIGGQIFNGYLSDIYFIDGSNPDISLFGQTVSGKWQPKIFDMSSYTGNSFHLDFSDAAHLGKDSSGNDNDWTPTNITEGGGLLIHGDTDISDASGQGHSITPSGSVAFTGSQTRIGDGSLYFDGSDDFLTVPDHEDWNFGTEDFTIDFWVKKTSVATSEYNMAMEQPSPGFYIDVDKPSSQANPGFVHYYNYGLGINLLGNYLAPNIWQHVAVVRNGNTWSLYQDGLLTAQTQNSGTSSNSTSPLYVGGYNWNTDLEGYLDEVRITKGKALWTSDFSANLPTGPASSLESRSPSQVSDTPTNNYITWDTVNHSSGANFSDGNRNGTVVASQGEIILPTSGVTSGKYYVEIEAISGFVNGAGAGGMIGLADIDLVNPSGTRAYYSANAYGYYHYDGKMYTSAAGTIYGNTFTGGDIIGIILDMDIGSAWITKNGVLQNSATESEILLGNTSHSFISGLSGNYGPTLLGGGTTSIVNLIVGEDDWNYTPPTGFKALSSQNMQ